MICHTPADTAAAAASIARDRAAREARAKAAAEREAAMPAPKIKASSAVPKIDQLRAFAAAGDWHSALRLAAKFQDLGDHKREITAGAEALARPGFYRQIKKDPDALVAAGIAALKARYGL